MHNTHEAMCKEDHKLSFNPGYCALIQLQEIEYYNIQLQLLLTLPLYVVPL